MEGVSECHISEYIINAIDALYETKRTFKENEAGHAYDRQHNPIVQIITPEWFHSGCHQILRTVSPTWEQLDRSRLIHKMTDDLNKKDFSFIQRNFEQSFCCWYQAYHYLPREKWGVHLRYDSILAVASDLRNKNKLSIHLTDYDVVKSALLYLYIHCQFHYLLENATSLMELILDNPSLYGTYLSNIYVNVFNTKACIEEALANRFMLQLASEYRIDERYLKSKLLLKGEGYRDFINFTGKKFQSGIRRLLCQIKYSKLEPPLVQPFEKLIDQNFSKNIDKKESQVPIWLHHSANPVY